MLEEIFNLYLKAAVFVLDSSWIWLPVFFAFIFFESWMYYIQRHYWSSLDWMILEVKPPREMELTPKNMEQVFAGLWGNFGTVSTKWDKYFKGMLQDYYSFELVGMNGEVHFYIRTLKKFRDVVEAQIYAQYPRAEIKEAEDYVYKIPADIPNKNWNLWGCKLKLPREDYYPIRTYPHFMDLSKADETFLDPMAAFTEAMGKLRPGEQVWIQLLFRPEADSWQKQAKKLADKLLGKKTPSANEGLLAFEGRTWFEALEDVASQLLTDKLPERAQAKKDEGPHSLMMFLSTIEKEIIQEIEEKAAKKGYAAKLQWAYLGRRDLFTMANVSAFMGIFNQFANLNMNSLIPDKVSMTKAAYMMAKSRKAFKQRKLLRLLRQRSFWEKGYIFNIEELATLYHFPTIGVHSPVAPYVEVVKGGAPVDLPIQ